MGGLVLAVAFWLLITCYAGSKLVGAVIALIKKILGKD